MVDPLEERNVSHHHRVQAVAGLCPVTWNPREPLRHQRGVVERLFLVRAEVGFGTGQPEGVAMQDDFPVSQRLTIATDQPFQGEREKAVDAGIDEFRCR